jgi:hypothetical protein
MKKYYVLLFLIVPVILFSGENKNKKTSYEFKLEFFNDYGSPASISVRKNFINYQTKSNDKKSLFLAGALSAILPGAGEFYSESYIKSGIFLGIEAASWIVNLQYNKKGDDQTKFFENYADQNWSVVKYAQWIEKNLNNFVPDVTNQDQCKLLFQKLYKSGSKPWEQVDFSVLNEIERIIGGAFSHTLPKYGEQQYYELIGKYPQFRQGWPDADPNDNQTYIHKDSLSAMFKYYSIERGKANDYYSVASTFISIVIINHIVSALDAVLSAYLYNKAHIDMSFQPMHLPSGKMVLNPYLNIRINF